MEKLVTCKFSTVPNTFWNIEHSSELNSEHLVFCFHPALQGSSLSLSHSALISTLKMSKIISQSLTSHPAQNPTTNCPLDISIMFHCLFKLNICTMELSFLSSPLLCSDRLSLHNPLFSLFLSVSLTHLPPSLSPPLLSLSHRYDQDWSYEQWSRLQLSLHSLSPTFLHLCTRYFFCMLL